MKMMHGKRDSMTKEMEEYLQRLSRLEKHMGMLVRILTARASEEGHSIVCSTPYYYKSGISHVVHYLHEDLLYVGVLALELGSLSLMRKIWLTKHTRFRVLMLEEISDREKALLGYSPNSSSNGQSRSSDVDFSDVFGGPPRRSSAQSIDLLSDDHNVEAEESRGSWFGSREKPVFGDQVGVRRRHQYDEFFDDIFRGDQPSLSGSQSPRVVPRRNPFSSAPGSRAMSPSRPLPPTAEPFASPAKFSLPSRMTNTDFMASMSANQSSSRPSLFRFNQSIQNHDYVCGDARSSYRPTALSRQVSVEAKESTSGTKIDGIADGPNIENNAETSGFPNDNASFHFSIYKWASKGVPIEISYRKRSPRSKDATKLDRYWSEIGDGVVTDILVSVNHKVDISENSPSFNKSGMPLRAQEINCDSCNDTNVTSKTEEYKSKDDTFQAKSEPTSYISPLNDVTSYGLEDAKEAQNFSKSSLTFDNSPKSCSEMNRSNMRLLGSFIEDEKTGNKTVKERMVKEKENPSPDDVIPGHTVNKIKLHGPSKEPKKDLRKSKTTSKVKEFVKIFNQESPSKAPKNFLGQSHSSRWEHGNIFVADHEVKSFSTRMHDEMPASYVNWEETWPETSKVVEENYSIPGKQQAGINGSGSAPNAATPTSAEPKSDGLNGSAPRNNATSNSGILYEDTLQDINIQSEIQSQEATESYESKVLQWSKGKEGNIRALLSTLQYVLWPNSGWKPTPLVDIIEANAVKRAYQKAMLCLHPDKLQQKGATMHQKFIAEKVFDTLQEAWDHFNSLGHL